MKKRVELDTPYNDKGETLREALTATREAYGYEDDRLHEPPLPVFVMELWNTFWKLDLRRDRGQWGNGLPLRYEQIDAYMRVKCHPLQPWEIEAIEAMDLAMLNAQAENKNNG